MNCESVKDLLVLLNCGELSFEEEEQIEQHLETCRDCAAERHRLEQLDAFLGLERVEASPDLLARCRRDLAARIRSEAPPSRLRQWWQMLNGTWWKPAAALALLAVGFLGGRALHSGTVPFAETAGLQIPAEVNSTAGSQPTVSKVQVVDSAPDGTVRVRFAETRQRELRGDPNDVRVRNLLLAAVNDQDPALRVDSIDLLRRHCDDGAVRKALIGALRSDRNSGVRLRALEALRSYALEPETRHVLAEVLLNDNSPAIRTQAIDLLTAGRASDMAGTLQEVLRHEENSYIRERSVHALQAMKASTGTF